MAERPETPQDPIAPETVNAEQEDAEAQAQTVAEEGMGRRARTRLEDSEKPGGGITDEGDTPDLVDHMKHMDSSGVIDMFAYRGEETMDDLENRYGRAGVVDEDFANDDS
ncbi:hypothetical protein [Novosphingobium colocasiae]|uniref:Uncharacterized protein n=1 Tax=Novosphingobium colocasiae TaxID=1256513 RepID=A0A918PDT2_9SPHN|nr:hypothetical protein [Novosphingobium colocasiae]GGZ00552.1 hypothetical protein GCM10011614_14500 [Novosphingobium colocasiae]